MIARNSIGSALVLALLLLPGLVGCQPVASNSAIEELNKSVKKLSDEMRDLNEASKGWANKKDVDSALAASSAAHNEQSDSLGQLAQKAHQQTEQSPKLEAVAKKDDQQAKRLAKLEADVKYNLEVTNDQRIVLGQIAKSVCPNKSILAIYEQTENDQFRKDFRKASDKVTPPGPPSRGTLRYENRMGTWQNLEVNGVSYWVGPWSSLNVTVPAGWVTTRLPGYEGARKWWVGEPDYFKSFTIDPRPIPRPIYSYDGL